MCIKGKIISSLGVSVLAFNVLLSTPIFANEYETNLEIQNEARYTHIDKASSNLSISGGVATLTASMTANPGVSKTLITSRLQKKRFTDEEINYITIYIANILYYNRMSKHR